MKRMLLPILAIGVLLLSACGAPTETITITPPTPEPPTQIIESLSPQEAFALIQDNQNNPAFVIIDVRTPEEVAGGYIEGAIFIDFYSDTFRDELDNLDKDKVYLAYCRTGGRSGPTLLIMEELGFMEVYDISGGFDAWEDAGLPVVG